MRRSLKICGTIHWSSNRVTSPVTGLADGAGDACAARRQLELVGRAQQPRDRHFLGLGRQHARRRIHVRHYFQVLNQQHYLLVKMFKQTYVYEIAFEKSVGGLIYN